MCPKVFSFPLPATAILHAHHLFLHHPSRLPGTYVATPSFHSFISIKDWFFSCVFPGNPKEKRYFFCKTSSHRPFSNPAGFWKPIINSHKFILDLGCNHPIGFKKCFVFYQISNQRRSRTPWILYQFRLLYPLPNKVRTYIRTRVLLIWLIKYV